MQGVTIMLFSSILELEYLIRYLLVRTLISVRKSSQKNDPDETPQWKWGDLKNKTLQRHRTRLAVVWKKTSWNT